MPRLYIKTRIIIFIDIIEKVSVISIAVLNSSILIFTDAGEQTKTVVCNSVDCRLKF